MPMSLNQKSWLFSITIHGLFLLMLWMGNGEIHPPLSNRDTPPLQITLYQPPQPKVVAKSLVTQKGTQKTTTVPTSLPGDRPQPAATKRVAPTYPKKALNYEWEGTVKVKVTVSSQGLATRVALISSSGHEALDRAFIRSVRQQYQFKPKRVMGKNTSGTIVLSHTFSLKESS
jgi:TonB family protein